MATRQAATHSSRNVHRRNASRTNTEIPTRQRSKVRPKLAHAHAHTHTHGSLTLNASMTSPHAAHWLVGNGGRNHDLVIGKLLLQELLLLLLKSLDLGLDSNLILK